MTEEKDIERLWDKLNSIDDKLSVVVRLEERSITQTKRSDKHSDKLEKQSNRIRKIENIINIHKGKVAVFGTLIVCVVTFVSNYAILKLKGF